MTVTLKAVPAVALVGALADNVLAAAAATVTDPVIPVIEPVTVSVAVTVWLPAVFKRHADRFDPGVAETNV